MAELRTHWTAAGTNEFLYRVGFDFVGQIEQAMEADGISQAQLAEALNVSEGRVSQVLNNPGNLTLRKIIEYARALSKKVAIIAYDDDDPENHNGPINARVFAKCWEDSGKPSDFFDLSESQAIASTASNCENLVLRKSPGRERHWVSPGLGAYTDSNSNTPCGDLTGTGITERWDERDFSYGRG